MFSNITDAWHKDPVKEISEKLSKENFRKNTPYEEAFNFRKKNSNLSDNCVSLFSDESTLSPIPYKKKYNKKNPPDPAPSHPKLKISDTFYNQLELLINERVRQKFNEMTLENKLESKLESKLENRLNKLEKTRNTSSFGSCWKEVVIVVAILIIVVLLLFIFGKTLNK